MKTAGMWLARGLMTLDGAAWLLIASATSSRALAAVAGALVVLHLYMVLFDIRRDD